MFPSVNCCEVRWARLVKSHVISGGYNSCMGRDNWEQAWTV